MMTLLLILLMSIIPGCKTTKVEETPKIDLPPKPQREIIAEGTSPAQILVYYESLVQKWEMWSETVEVMWDYVQE